MRIKLESVLSGTGIAVLLSVASAGCLSMDGVNGDHPGDDENLTSISRKAPNTPNALAVDLGTAGDFAILSKAGISTVPSSDIVGDIGVSPIAATAITGFSLTADATNVFATSLQVTGKVYAANYAVPAPANMTTAVSDMETAFLY